MMKGIAQDFVRYIMHVQVVSEDEPSVVVRDVQETSSDNVGTDGFLSAAAAEGVDPALLAAQAEAQQSAVPRTVRKDEDDWSNTPRNAPCPCGSGRKYKQCHGAA
jgi:preprotein translocase subunit SecA